MQHNKPEVKNDSSISCTFYDDDFVAFEKHTTGIGSKLLKKMGYQGKGLSINGQCIVNPIKVEKLPRYAGLGYVKKEVGECSNIASEQPMTDDKSTSSHSNDSEGSTGTYQRCTKNKLSKTIQKSLEEKESL